MILPSLVLLAVQVAPAPPTPMPTPKSPTLAMIEGLSPQAAGEIVLANRTHEPIVQVLATQTQAMAPPGSIERQLIERPVAGAEGCSRRRWTAMFHHGPGAAPDQATLISSMATTEIAPTRSAGCPADGYARLNPGAEPAQAFAALDHLDQIKRGTTRVQFTCSDTTASTLCADPVRGLAKLSAWAVNQRQGQAILWLGEPGQIVTEVSWRLDRPDQVAVSRRIPAPF